MKIPVLNKFSTRYFTIVRDFVDFLGIVHYCTGLAELCGPAPMHPVRRPAYSCSYSLHPAHAPEFVSILQVKAFNNIGIEINKESLLTTVLHRFVQRILNNPALKVEEQSEMVHDFYGVCAV